MAAARTLRSDEDDRPPASPPVTRRQLFSPHEHPASIACSRRQDANITPKIGISRHAPSCASCLDMDR
eukprot:4905360-Prymnesium_polylepis.1